MRFIVRSVRETDIDDLDRLARHDALVHLPPDKKVLDRLVTGSIASFAGETAPEEGRYVFVIEDTGTGKVVGASLIFAGYVSPDRPYHYFRVLTKKVFDAQLNRAVRQPVLRPDAMSTGLSAIGGLVVEPGYRGNGEKVGTQIALTRFVYMGMFPERFQDTVLCEFMAPLDADGRNPFWKAVGGKFTGIGFEQVLALMRAGEKDAIVKRLPGGDICLGGLDRALRPSAETLHLFYGKAVRCIEERAGFRYINAVDFDGGLLYQAAVKDIGILQKGGLYKVEPNGHKVAGQGLAWLGRVRAGVFKGGLVPCRTDANTAFLSPEVMDHLALETGDTLYLSPVRGNVPHRLRNT